MPPRCGSRSVPMSTRCLLLVDLQNEFLSPNGNFPILEESRSCLVHISAAARAFHEAGDAIFWIRAEYGSNGVLEPSRDPNSWILHGTHTGRKACCAPDTPGAEFPDDITSLIEETSAHSAIVTKSWYSAFKETALSNTLKECGITDVYIGGVVTNICVLATATHAHNLGYKVTVLNDCLGWRNRESHQKALESLRGIGCEFKPTSMSNRM